MAKRSRRSRKNRAREQRISRTAEPTPSKMETGSPAAPPASLQSGQYEYVITDLKRVGILAAAMFALLIALSFLLPSPH